MMMGLPTIALIYDAKTVELLKGENKSRYIPITLDELDASKLKEATNSLSTHGN